MVCGVWCVVDSSRNDDAGIDEKYIRNEENIQIFMNSMLVVVCIIRLSFILNWLDHSEEQERKQMGYSYK